MKATTQNALNAYTRVGVTSVADADPHKLILMLYEGAIKSVARARLAMSKGEIATKCEAISKAMAIIQDGLQLSLDVKAGGELAQNLNDLYEYMCGRLLIANARNQTEPLDEVGRLLVDLKGAWASIGQKQQPQPQKAEAQNNVPLQRSNAISYGKA